MTMPDSPAIGQLQTNILELSDKVGTLAANVQTQTALFELHIENIEKNAHGLKNAIKVQDGNLDRIERDVIGKIKEEISELRHRVKSIQTYPKTLNTVVSRLQALENQNIKARGQVQGFTWAVRAIWIVGTALASVVSSFITWRLSH